MLRSLYLRNFRNIEELDLHFGPQANVFYGLNAQGKTNLLEAIALLSTGRSFRTQQLPELIREGAAFFFLEALFDREGISQSVRVFFDGKNKKVEYNASSYPSFQPLLGLIPSVFFTPQDSDLITGSPALRRRFLDMHLAQSDPLYVHHLLRFWRAIRQRNTQLRTKSLEGIDCWEQEMALSATYLLERRNIFLRELNSLINDCPLKKESIELRYQPSQPEQNYLAQLTKNRKRELHLGFTLTGPHRDDFTLYLAEKPSRPYASEGQKRCASATLRLAEWQRLHKETGTTPLFGIDDFELHLDRERQDLFQNTAQALGQIFVTSPEEPTRWKDARCFLVESGKISQRD